MVMPDYSPCHRASDRYAPDAEASEGDWLDERSEEIDSYEAIDADWLIEDWSDRAQAYEQPAEEVRSSEVPFPELIEAAIQVMQAAQDAGIEF